MTFAQPFSGYEILGRLGSGAMGTVFRARHRRLNRVVALKVLKPALARNKRFVDRLRREARIVASLDHPNIVKGYDLGEEGGYHFFVMEFVEGRSLRELLAEWGAFPRQKVIDVAVQVASALDHALARGVIHRDIKPGNILIDQRGRVKLTDMGLAKGPADVTITRDGATVGTPQYISPEQARNPQEADVRSDLYSLGATLYHMATGTPPFRGETMAEVINQVLHQQPRPPVDLDPEVGAGLSLVIRKLLAKDPAARYQQPAELLEDLGRILRDETPAISADDLLPRRSRLAKVPRRWQRIGALAVVVFLLGIGWLLTRERGDNGAAVLAAGGVAEFRAGLVRELDRQGSFAAKFALLDQRSRTVSDPVLRSELADLRLVVERALRVEVDRFFDDYLDPANPTRTWFEDPLNWRGGSDAFFGQVLPDAMLARCGYRPESLPPAILEHVRQDRLPALRARAEQWQRERDDRYLEAHDRHLRQVVTVAWRSPLAAQPPDFALARRALGEGFDAFYGTDGRPLRTQLPDALRLRVEQAEAVARAEAEERIADRAQQVARALETEAHRGLADLDAQLRGGAPESVIRELFEQLQRDLAAQYPVASFVVERSPWPEVQAELKAFDASLAAAQRLGEANELDRALRLAYARLAATARVDDAINWIAGLSLSAAAMQQLRDAHLRVLGEVRDAAQAVYSALLAGESHRAFSVGGRGRDGRVQVELDRGVGLHRLRLLDAQGRELPVTSISWAELLALAGDSAAAPPTAERARLRSGQAVWLALCGDAARVQDYLDADDVERRRFFQEHLAELIERARMHQQPADISALDQLQQLERALRAADAAAVRRALAVFDADHADDALDGDGRSLLAQGRSWLTREDWRQSLQASLGGEVRVQLTSDANVELEYRLAARAIEPGWSMIDDRLVFAEQNVDLGAAFASTLRLLTNLDKPRRVALRMRVRFPAGGAPRLYVLELHGVAACLGVLESGAAAVAILPAEHVQRPSELQRALQGPLLAAARAPVLVVVDDAIYDLELSIDLQRRRRQIEFRLGGEVLGSAALAEGRGQPELRVTPLQPLVIDRLRVTAWLDP